jgi:MFS family permease
MVGLERVLGTYGSIQAMAFAAGAAPAIGAYVLLYGWGLGWRSAVLAGFLAPSAGTGEAMAWGGYPQLIGIGLLPVFVLALDRFLVARDFRTAIPAALLLLASLATSDLVGPITVVVGLVYLAVRYAVLRKQAEGNSFRNLLLGMALSIVLALPLAPIYLGLVPGAITNHPVPTSVLNDTASIQSVIGDFRTFWTVCIGAALLTPVALIARRDYRLIVVSLSVIATSVALMVTGGIGRPAYLLPLGVVIGLGAWTSAIDRLPDWIRSSFNAAIITCLVIDVIIGTQHFADQQSYYSVINPGLVQGLTKLSAVSGSQQVVAVSPAQNDWALGWWVEGAASKRTIYAGNPIYLNFQDEKARNTIANRIFSPENDLETSRQLARDAGAAYLFIDKKWSDYSVWSSHGRGAGPAAVVYENDSVLIVATGG